MSKETSYKKEPHVYAEVIHAWADGQDIEYRINGLNDEWCTSNINSGDVLSWSTKCEYRIKPKPPKNIELYANADFFGGHDKGDCISPDEILGNFTSRFISTDNLKLSFCPMTGKLIAAELVKHEKADDNE